MSKSKSTRSSKIKKDLDDQPKVAKAPALRKVFYISQKMLDTGDNNLKLERFFHPGKGKPTLFITTEQNKVILEVLEYAEPRRSWLINQDVCSNGKLYLTTPMDVIFLALHHIKKHCAQRALALDCISDDKDESVVRLLMTYVEKNQLKCIADVKTTGDMIFYKYNPDKALAWLSLKTQRVADSLRKNGVHCGLSALSQNYAKSEAVEQVVQDVDYLRFSCDFVGGYVDLELHEKLRQYLDLPAKMEEKKEANEKANKRKSLQSLKGSGNKKIKLEANKNASENLENSSLLNSSLDEPAPKSESELTAKPTPLKERPLTSKEKSLAKVAKGSKSISSFFKRSV